MGATKRALTSQWPEWHDDLDRLLESAVDVVLGQPEGMRLATGMPGAQAEHEAAPADLIERLPPSR